MEAQDRLRALLANPGFASNAEWERPLPLWTQLTHMALFHTVQDAIDLFKERNLATPAGTCLCSDLVPTVPSALSPASAVRKGTWFIKWTAVGREHMKLLLYSPTLPLNLFCQLSLPHHRIISKKSCSLSDLVQILE